MAAIVNKVYSVTLSRAPRVREETAEISDYLIGL